MGNITSRQATNLVDNIVLSLARTIDAVLRSVNRRLSLLSSLFFSRVFGYDVVFADDPPTELVRKESLVCGPGNVCIVPASRIQQRQLEKKRRSERRKRAEAAARGERLRGYAKVESGPNSPVTEKSVRVSLGDVAKAPAARPVEERQTIAEKERGKLWIMGNIQPSSSSLTSPTSPTTPTLPITPIDRSFDIQHRIQPRKSSKHAHRLLAPTSSTPKIQPVVEKDESIAEAGFDSDHMMPRLHAPQARVLPAGALSLGPSPWDAPAFRHPFSDLHEPLMTSRAKHQLRAHQQQQQRPKLSLDTQVEISSMPNVTSPTTFGDDLPTRPPSAASARRFPARKSIDAISVRSSVDLPHLDVKTLATKAVKEEKGRKVWKDQVERQAKEKCLAAGGGGGRRYSLAASDALTRVRTGRRKWQVGGEGRWGVDGRRRF